MQQYNKTSAVPPRATDPQGFWGWWLRLTAPPHAGNYATAPNYADRQRLRRAGLISAIAPFVAIMPLLLLQQAGVDTLTLGAVVANVGIAAIALMLNRAGLQALSGVILVVGMDLVIEAALLGAGLRGGLGSGWLLTFDLFIIPVVVAGLVLSRNLIWSFATLHIALILGDFYLLPHAADLNALTHLWGGPGVAIARPIMIQAMAAILSYTGVRSTDQATERADRAEEVARLEHDIAEQKHQLDGGIQQLLEVHVRAANGDFTARAPLSQDNILWQVAASLNNMLSRLQRSAQAEFQLRRTDEEIDRLRTALLQVKQGRHPIWPAPTGTRVDTLLEVLVGPAQSPGSPWGGPATGELLQAPTPSGPQAPGREALPPFPTSGGLPPFGGADPAQGNRWGAPEQPQWRQPGPGDDSGMGQVPPNPWFKP